MRKFILFRAFRSISYVLIAHLLVTTAALAQGEVEAPADSEGQVGENLFRIDNTRLQNAYVDPTVDWARFETIFVAALDVSSVKVVQPPRDPNLNRPPAEFVLTDDDRHLLQAFYSETMHDRLFEHGGFTAAPELGPNVLLVRIGVIEVAPTAHRSSDTRSASRSVQFTEGAGSISIEGIMQDGETGKLLAIFSDTHSGSRFWGRNDRFNNRQQVRRIFDYWARLLVRKLNEVKGT